VIDAGAPTQASFCKPIVVLPPVAPLPTSNVSVCAADSLKIGRHINGAQYTWSTGAITDSVFVKTAGTYWVDINRYGCITRDSFVLTIKPIPVLSLTKANDVNCSRPTNALIASGANAYTWSPASAVVSGTGSSVVVKPAADTWFIVTGTGSNNCVSKDSVKVLAKFKGADDFYVANAFTPNGDGLNDCFGVHYWSGVSDFQFHIFDRWGVEVFKTTNVMQCWDGTYKGKRQGNNRYVYYIKTNTACGPILKKGVIVLIR
jgi:gliding motility-associated-like protein